MEVYAGYLRRKIGTDRLSTVRGVGYRLPTVNRFWRLSLRARLMIIGVTGVAVALVAGGLAFYGALTLSLNRTVDNEALATARTSPPWSTPTGCPTRSRSPARR